MSVPIIIAGTQIEFPESGTAPDYAPAMVQFAEAVEDALSSAVGTYDVVPQRMVLDSVPDATDTNITNLSFSVSTVRGAFIRYACYRDTSTTTVTESGTLTLTYNETNSSGNQWEVVREYVGDAQISFIVTDTGQVQINTTALGGSGYTGFISYAGTALQNTY